MENKVILCHCPDNKDKDKIGLRLSEHGIKLCQCCYFDMWDYLSYGSTIGTVHGIANDDYVCEVYGKQGNISDTRMEWIAYKKEIIDCGEDLEMFIKQVLDYEKQ